jgi:hypothetical protein
VSTAEAVAVSILRIHLYARAMKVLPNKPWKKLCEEAAVEQDARRFLHLVTEINRLLDEERSRREDSRDSAPWLSTGTSHPKS